MLAGPRTTHIPAVPCVAAHAVRRAMRRAGRVVGLGLSGLFVVAGGLSSALGLPAGSHRDVAAHLQPTVQGTHGSTVDTHAPTTKLLDEAQCVATPGIRIPCYDPAQIQAAYDEQPLFDAGITGVGETIVIVDSFGSPTLRSDLATFDRRFRLPAPPTLQVIQPAGPVPRYDAADTTMSAGPARPPSTSSGRTRSHRGPRSSWSRRRCPRPRARPAFPRSSPPRTT